MSSTIGQRIATVRKAQGMTQKELAKLLEITRRRVAFYENESEKLSSDIILKLMNIFEVDAETILGVSKYSKMMNSNELLKEKCKIAESFDERDKAIIIDMIDALMYKY